MRLGLGERKKGLSGYCRRHVVAQRMRVNWIAKQDRPVEDKGNQAIGIVNDGKRRHRAGRDAERLHQHIGAAKGQVALRAKPVLQRLKVHRALLIHSDEPHPPFLVAQEQVLYVAALKLAAFGL